jgi:hypothetical protein
MLHDAGEAGDVGVVRFVVAADGVDPDEGAAGGEDATAFVDEVDFGFA